MKVAIIIENNINVGGGFTMSVEILLLLKKILKKNNIDFFVINYDNTNNKIFSDLNISHKTIKDSILDKIFALINYSLIGMYLQRKLKYLTSLEKILLKNNCNFAVFVTPSPKPFYLQKINYATTVYDICHHDYPEFSELSEFNIFKLREILIKNTIGQSVFVITESKELKYKLAVQYGKSLERIISIPNITSPFLNLKDSLNEEKIFLKKNNLNNYYFYPAQFWSHKNHIRILQSIKKIASSGNKIQFVFCGHDKGNLIFLKKKIDEYKINKYVKIFGFVKNSELKILYKNCKAVVMPTYLGPTNIPPLDAWYFKKPLIYSKHLVNQVKNAALLIDPNSVDELVVALKKINNKKIANKLIKNGIKMLANTYTDRARGEKNLEKALLQFDKIKETWC